MVIHTHEDLPIRLGSEHCFYCGEPIKKRPFIQWLGDAATEIILHPACALELCVRLLRDVHEVECQYNESVMLASEGKKRAFAAAVRASLADSYSAGSKKP